MILHENRLPAGTWNSTFMSSSLSTAGGGWLQNQGGTSYLIKDERLFPIVTAIKQYHSHFPPSSCLSLGYYLYFQSLANNNMIGSHFVFSNQIFFCIGPFLFKLSTSHFVIMSCNFLQLLGQYKSSNPPQWFSWRNSYHPPVYKSVTVNVQKFLTLFLILF